jgi:hypothetical protein
MKFSGIYETVTAQLAVIVGKLQDGGRGQVIVDDKHL